MTAAPRAGERGFTLIEMIVSLALFALIALAGIALLRTVMGVQERTAGRIERLGDVQRALFMARNDIEQFSGKLVLADAELELERHSRGPLGVQPVRYRLRDGMLRRAVDTGLGTARDQRLLTGVDTLRISVLAPDGGWRDRWPPDGDATDPWPLAVALDIGLAPGPRRPGGTLRRVFILPVKP